MTSILITKHESTVLILAFLLLFIFRTPTVVLFIAVALTALFFVRRKDIYFAWSMVAPRITGDAVHFSFKKYKINAYFFLAFPHVLVGTCTRGRTWKPTTARSFGNQAPFLKPCFLYFQGITTSPLF
jgi:hypothetical protein